MYLFIFLFLFFEKMFYLKNIFGPTDWATAQPASRPKPRAAFAPSPCAARRRRPCPARTPPSLPLPQAARRLPAYKWRVPDPLSSPLSRRRTLQIRRRCRSASPRHRPLLLHSAPPRAAAPLS